MSSVPFPVRRSLPAARLFQAGLLAAFGAAAANLLLYFIARTALGQEINVAAELGGVLGPAPVLIASAAAGLAATLGYLALHFFSQRPLYVFQGSVAAFALFSLVSPLTAAGVDGNSQLILTMMHFVAAAVVVGVLTRAARAD
ncbi:MAG TPA: DUF6069 family protein [Herpetosiphonaceae bacterium]